MSHNNADIKSNEHLKQELDHAFDALYVTDMTTSKKIPKVCTVCDRFVRPRHFTTLTLEKFEKVKFVLETEATESLPRKLKADYVFKVPQEFQTIVGDSLLSPRGIFMYNKKNQPCMSICSSCKCSLTRAAMPTAAIANGYFFGSPPDCLLDLTPIEMAWISPVTPKYGMAFVYYGGQMRQLRGTLSYFKKPKQSIVLASSKLEILGLTQEGITVALVGSVTEQQKQKVHEMAKIRPARVLAAVKWLIENNEEWRSIDYQKVKSQVQQPVVVQDHADLVCDLDSNIERTSVFRVVFRDATLDQTRGGQQNAIDFLRLALREGAGKEVQISSSFKEERVQDYEGRNLLASCLTQCPYGRGGLEETHYDEKGNVKRPSHKAYIEHLSSLSQTQFHDQLFVLKLYNYRMRDQMVRNAVIQCKNRGTAKLIAQDVTGSALLNALEQKKQQQSISSFPASKLLRAVDAVAEAAPHSNQAARKARNRIEVLQHHFGFPDVFLTVTPDDENTILLDIYAFKDLDLERLTWDEICQLNNEEIKARGKARKELRLSVPGICAWTFENQLDAIVKHVIGWDKLDGENKGYYGKCQAFVASIEEQGRKTIHGHFLIWIEKLREQWKSIHGTSSTKRDCENAKANLCQFIDRVSSCTLVGNSLPQKTNHQIFPHKNMEGDEIEYCPYARCRPRNMQQPRLISKQRLRDLRHPRGSKIDGGTFLICQHEGCNKRWTSETVIKNFLTKQIGLTSLESYPDKVNRLKLASMYRVQMGGLNMQNETTTAIFQAGYNHHRHAPTSCFKCKKTTGCECRYRFPRAPRRDTKLLNTKRKTKWFSWNGDMALRTVYEPAPKRHKLDVFINQSSPAVGQTKLIHGNTNVMLLVPGGIATYVTKYVGKSTQKDDSADFTQVSERVQNSINKISERNLQRRLEEQNGSLSDEDRRDRDYTAALSATLSMAFSTTAKDVIGAPLAAYLLRNDSRFLMSHQTQYIFMADIEKLMEGEPVRLYRTGTKSYACNSAYDYLCRPTALEKVSAFNFYSDYTPTKKKPREEHGEFPFVNTEDITHPSWQKATKTSPEYFKGGIKTATSKRLIQIPRCWLPDTASFGGEIGNIINEATEEYSKKAMMLFVPFRKEDDLRRRGQRSKALIDSTGKDPHASVKAKSFATNLQVKGSYTEQFEYCLEHNIITSANLEYLQNFQNCTYNCWKVDRVGDELERETEKYRYGKKGNEDYNISPSESESEEEEEPAEAEDMANEITDAMIAELCGEHERRVTVPEIFSTAKFKRGEWKNPSCNNIATMNPSTTERLGDQDLSDSWLEVSSCSAADDSYNSDGPENGEERQRYSDVLQIVIRETKRIIHKGGAAEGKSLHVANGSAESIIDWSTNSNLDEWQEAAFEILASTFVLSFFEDQHRGDISYDEERFEREKEKLERLSDRQNRKSDQLICLLHGPGGSGKSWIVELLLKYAEEYCSFIEGFTFDRYTILVTAMTGSAATLLNGETTHSALGLTRDGATKVTNEDRVRFANTKMMLIDESSFSDASFVKRTSKQLNLLLNAEEPSIFGNVNILFIGDFRQLDPPGRRGPLYKSTFFREIINCYVELHGLHRFKKDPEWGRLLRKFRDGTVTLEDIDQLNATIVVNERTKIPENVKYACFYNKDRDSINTAVFDKTTKGYEEGEGLVVLCDDIKARDPVADTLLPMRNYNKVWNNVGEADAKSSGSRIDPALRLYRGIRVMVTKNKDVANGIANGTQAYLTKVMLHPGQQYSTTVMEDGTGVLRPMKSVLASQIKHIVLKHHNKNICNSKFRISPERHSFSAKLPSLGVTHNFRLNASQLPIVIDNATTGHKLQGVSVKSIFVHSWVQPSNTDQRNWNYVVLSRSETRNGVFARQKLPRNVEMYSIPPELLSMIAQFEPIRPRPAVFRRMP